MIACKQSLIRIFWFSVGALSCLPAYANPQGASVVHGSAQFSNPDANTLEVTNSNRAVINWQSFSIDQGETTRFVQPSSGSAVLNRVTGADPSAIYGQLNSNGRVFLINRNGILVGESGVINTAGFVGSTLDISNGDFLNNELNFAGENAGSILNNGFIAAGPGGEIVLVAPEVENRGTITAENGRILLAAGEKVKLGSAGLDNIQFEVQAPDNSVLNLGELIAERGSVGVFAGSIQHNGVIEANSIGTDDAGNIVLKAQSNIDVGADALVQANGTGGGDITIQSETGDSVVRGTVEAIGNDGRGGNIKILGDRVGLFGHAYVDASGTTGGGEVLIGGDYQGKGSVQTARQTQVNPDAEIHVDALDSGNGGRAIVWADGVTSVYGAVTARGGSTTGDGGFIEVSGKEDLVFRGRVDTSAVDGRTGTVLFDPADITINSTTQATPFVDDTFAEDVSASVTFGTDGANGLNAMLDDNNVELQANNDILISAAGIIGQNGNDLTLRAGRRIDMQAGPASITTNGGNVLLVANSTLADGVQSSERLNGSGDIIIADDLQSSFIDAGTGNITLEIRDGFQAGTIQINAAGSLTTSSGDITLRSDNGVVAASGASINAGAGRVIIENYTPGATIDLGAGGGGDQTVDNTLASAISASELVVGSATTGNITVAGTFSPAGTPLSILSGQNLVFNQGSAIGLQADATLVTVDVGGQIVDNSGGVDIENSGAVLDLTAVGGMRLQTTASELRFDNTGDGDVLIENTGDLLVTAGNNAATGSFTEIRSASQLSVNGNITGNGGDIILKAVDFDLIGGTIDAGANAKTIFKSAAAGANWTLGGGGILDETELNNVANNIAIGAADGDVANITIGAPVALTGQNLDIHVGNNITFDTDTLAGISGADRVRLITDDGQVNHNTGTVDVQALSLTVTTQNGINGLQTQVTQLAAQNTDTGAIDITNSGTDLTIAGPGVRNDAGGPGEFVSVVNNGGNLTVDGAEVTTLGGDIVLDAAGDLRLLGGDQANRSADIRAGDTGAYRNVTLNAGNNIVLQGGTVADNRANVRGNDVGVNAGGNVSLRGGTASGAAARIEAGSVSMFANDLTLRAGSAFETTAGIDSINQFNAVLTGDVTLQGGSGDSAIAVLGLGDDSGSNPASLRMEIGGDLSLTGGSGEDAVAAIGSNSSPVNIGIGVNSDGMSVPVGGNITLTAGSGGVGTGEGLGAVAAIGTFGGGNTADVTVNAAQSLTMTSGAATGNDAFIGAKDAGGTVNIDVGQGTNGGNLNINTGRIITDGTANLTARAGASSTRGNINLNGGSIDVGALQAAADGRNNWRAGTVTIAGTAFSNISGELAGGATLRLLNNGLNMAGGTIGALQLGGDLLSQGAVTLNVTGATDVNNGGIGSNVILNTNGGINIAGNFGLSGTVNNNGAGAWSGSGDVFAIDGVRGTFNNRAGGVFTIANNRVFDAVFVNRGIVRKASSGVTQFTGGFEQQAGVLAGIGTIRAPLVNIAGGRLAPGTGLGPVAVNGQVGTLTIDGDLALGAEGTLSLDLMGADNDAGRQAGVLYDRLRVTGNAQIGGGLEMVVNYLRYPGFKGDVYRPFDFAEREGRFVRVSSRPDGYSFGRRETDQGVTLYMTATPYGDALGEFISEDEIQTLNRELGDQLEELVRMRRKDVFTGELPESDEERKKRRAMVCS